MELTQYISVGLSALGLVGGFISYVLGLRIKADILENNEKIDKEIQAIKDANVAAITNLRTELVREIGTNLNKFEDAQKKLDKELHDLQANFTDRILNAVNGKYVRTDLHQQTVANIQERFVSLKEVIEVNMEKIEQGLDRQILDLKDRIFHGK
jgi:predicted transcriptional regulator